MDQNWQEFPMSKALPHPVYYYWPCSNTVSIPLLAHFMSEKLAKHGRIRRRFQTSSLPRNFSVFISLHASVNFQ